MRITLTIFLVFTIGLTEVVLPLMVDHEAVSILDISSEGESESESENEKEKDKTPLSQELISSQLDVLALHLLFSGLHNEFDDLIHLEVQGPPPDCMT